MSRIPLPYRLIERFLSTDRLTTYLHMAGGNHDQAVGLYLNNLHQCQRFYAGLHWLEIGLRNAINKQLSDTYGVEWYNSPVLALANKECEQIEKAKNRLIRENKPITNGSLIAELSFGFWVNLFNAPYDSLWRYGLRKAFAVADQSLQRKQVSSALHPILKLRNRIAHYEPILRLDLESLWLDMDKVIQWIEPEAKGLLNNVSKP